jgi:hypothetical protein
VLDFIRLAQRHHVPYAEAGNKKCSQGWVQTPCPNCDMGTGDYHLGFSLKQGSFHCWRCGTVPFWEALAGVLRLQDRGRLHTLRREFETNHKQEPPAPVTRRLSLPPPPDTGPLLEAHQRYLTSRNFRPEQLVSDWDLQGTGRFGENWRWRVIIPIHNQQGQIIAYQGRSIGTMEPKYKMTNDEDCIEDPATMLYGIEKVTGDSVIVVEGCTGVWRLGFGSVATLGIDWKMEQVNRLRKFKRRFILFDPSENAQKKAVQLASALSLFPGTTEVIAGFDQQPGEFSVERAKRVRNDLLS